MITCKVEMKGVPLITTREPYTKTYHICEYERKEDMGLFVHPNCEEYNADLNRAINKAKPRGGRSEPNLNHATERGTQGFSLG